MRSSLTIVALYIGRIALCLCLFLTGDLGRAQSEKPILHGRHWIAITGKPLAATAGAQMFERDGNAVDAACAMLGAVSTMFDDISWGGEVQALIYNPLTQKVVGINACGVAPTGATPERFQDNRPPYPPGEGPLASLTPGVPGGIMVMLAEYGTRSLKEVLKPAMQLAEGYPIEEELARKIIHHRSQLRKWRYSRALFLPNRGRHHESPLPGEIFRQPDLLETLRKLVEAEQRALKEGKSRKEAIYAAYDRFYKGDIAEEFCRASKELGGLHTLEDLRNWKVHLEEPVTTNYKGIDVYKLTTWTQGPVLLQCLNLLEPLDLQSMGYNSTRYIHSLYQVMNLAFADRDFYYGDPYLPPEEPIKGLLSKSYARERLEEIDWSRNRPDIGPGDPYPHEDKNNPYKHLLKRRFPFPFLNQADPGESREERAAADRAFRAGTTSIQAADKNGWAVSITPSGGWIPAVIAGKTGVGMNQRMQSFVLNPRENPFNVLEPGKRPRITLTPSIALKDRKPFLCFSMQGGDAQDQSLLQFFLNIVEFDMNVQEACEAANFESKQMHASFGEHKFEPGRITLNELVPPWVRKDLARKGYRMDFREKTSGPITAILFDQEKKTFQGGASNDGEDYGIAW